MSRGPGRARGSDRAGRSRGSERAGRRLLRLASPALLAATAALVAAPPALAGGGTGPGGTPMLQQYEWIPAGPDAGPLVEVQVKSDVTGRFGVQCGPKWVYTFFGGGEHDPITESSAGLISGTQIYPSNSIGVGASFREAVDDEQLVDSGGPLVMTLSAQAAPFPARIPAAITGTLALTLYSPGSPTPPATATAGAVRRADVASSHGKPKRKRRRKPKPKPRSTVIASCRIPFTAANYYAEG